MPIQPFSELGNSNIRALLAFWAAPVETRPWPTCHTSRCRAYNVHPVPVVPISWVTAGVVTTLPDHGFKSYLGFQSRNAGLFPTCSATVPLYVQSLKKCRQNTFQRPRKYLSSVTFEWFFIAVSRRSLSSKWRVWQPELRYPKKPMPSSNKKHSWTSAARWLSTKKNKLSIFGLNAPGRTLGRWPCHPTRQGFQLSYIYR